jgi:hypothetical protein
MVSSKDVTSVEEEPAAVQEEAAKCDEGLVVGAEEGLAARSEPVGAWLQDECGYEGACSANKMDNADTSVVVVPLLKKPASAEDPMAGKRVDPATEDERSDAPSNEGHSLSGSSRHDTSSHSCLSSLHH